MTREEDQNNEVYQNLTQKADASGPINHKWTLYLALCCITVTTSSLIFGYNIGATNLPTPLIKQFFVQNYFAQFFNQSLEYKALDGQIGRLNALESKYNENKDIKTSLESNETQIEEAENGLNLLKEELNLDSVDSIEGQLAEMRLKLNETGAELEAKRGEFNEAKVKVDAFQTLIWTVTTALFVVGGMIGAFTSKYVSDYFGRKKGIIFHHLFTVSGAVLVLIAPYVKTPECVIVSRFIYGIQGGMSCGLIPTYLSEISPANLRGATGVVHQLCVTIGILVAQTLGFRQLMGTADLWHFLLAIPLIPCLIGTLSLLLFFPESPRALLINNGDENAATQALRRLRNSNNVSAEIEEMSNEAKETKSDEAISLKDLFTLSELRWPLITGLVLQLAQQLCGINAIFFYSEGIFRNASIQESDIQYAVFLTGFINVICTIVCVPLIDRLGRKPLLVYPMIVIIFDFILLTIFLTLQDKGMIFSYLSIVCIIVFIMCFAVGLGPIPFLYVAECFRQDARSAALAICMFTNWVANLVLTLTFPYLAQLLANYVFLVFTVIVGIAVIVILKKVPETKGRSTEEIMAHFQGRKVPKYTGDESGKLMANSKV
ncbi:solute carrier family facilitated glucose transporter member 1-like [Brachionus plicatilis]|uniref:Solute carrier family facilitated glucose transporter member 1-like n=1 Tax=Brachionus plicatilis TaxID=10195 RepID=A0A3M7SK71_BRAPC|nr:solute carrier family facilitated glucose transporter member 1-like [Brachionus plicatilis]